jgi:16S rRNA (cytosine1402-N4)-methyltransferase
MENKIKNEDDKINQNAFYHQAVLLHESIEQLNIQKNGCYVDATFGGGGHASMILKQLGSDGKLLVFDQDEDALKNSKIGNDVIFIRENFKYASRFVRLHGFKNVQGILADLGVSSHQFDTAERGFSIRFDAPLDMRMDTRQNFCAADIIKNYSEEQLHLIFEKYGEVTNSKTLAKTIVEARKFKAIETIEEFKQTLSKIVKGNPNKYFAQVFQALRIEVNDELGVLETFLKEMIPMLSVGGRIAIITFHSLEDRIVKQCYQSFGKTSDLWTEEEKFLGRKTNINKEEKNGFKLKIFKPIEASKQELKNNNRSRSAKLRVAERIN